MKVFQSFRLDTVNHCLWRAEERVPITPKAFDVLRYLVEHADRLVTQDEILEALWPETYVNPEVIKKYVLGIRKVLGDQPDKPVFVATLPRRGYQFIAPVRDEGISSPSEITAHTTKTVVGRESALAQVDACFNKALQGQRQVIFVTGEAGIGKTTLADVFHQRAAFRPNLRVARGQCVEGFGGKEAYYPMLEAIGQLLREADGSPVTQALAKRAPTWLIQFPSLVKTEQREALQKEILGATRERMVREICEALEAMTAENPLLLILEDLHWVDPSTLDLISALARRRGPAKMMLLGTYRPADVIISQSPLKALKQDLLVHDLCHEIALERLEESNVAEYLSTRFLEGQFPEGLAKLVYRHSGGNALFMVGIVQDMVKKGLIARTHERWTLTTTLDDVDPGVPETLQQLIQVQFEQLSTSEQLILKSASVAGEGFSVWDITSTMAMEPSAIENLCEALADHQQFIKPAGIHELANGEFSAHYEFRHSLYREVLYRRLSEANRAKLHRLLGERMKALCTAGQQELGAKLALHFEKGHAYEEAVRNWVLTAANSATRFAYRDAIEMLQHARTLIPKIAPAARAKLEIQVLDTMGDSYYCLGAMVECAQTHEAQAALAAQAGLHADEVCALNALARPFGMIDQRRGIAAVERAVQISATLSDPSLHARCQALAACTRLVYEAWRQEDVEVCASASKKLREVSPVNPPGYPEMLYGYILTLQGNYQEALRIAEAGMPKTNELAGLMVHFFSLGSKMLALLLSGQFGQLMQILREGRALAERNGNVPWILRFREAWLRLLVLDFEGAQRVGESISETDVGHYTAQPNTISKVAAGYVELERGNHDRALQCFRRILGERPASFFLHWYWRLQAGLGMGNVWLAAGDLVNARAEADRLLESALSTAEPNLQGLAWELDARVALAENDWKRAEESVRKAVAVLEKFTVPVSAWRVHETAWKLYNQKQDNEAAEAHRKRAEAEILTLANSFEPDEPLRKSFLAAAQVRRILDGAVKSKTLRQSGPSSVAM